MSEPMDEEKTGEHPALPPVLQHGVADLKDLQHTQGLGCSAAYDTPAATPRDEPAQNWDDIVEQLARERMLSFCKVSGLI